MGTERRPLRELAIAMGTDKQGAHAYADIYEHHLGHLRARPIRLLEIGIGGFADPQAGGASLRMWKAYFPLAEIVGIDIHDKSALAEDRITILRGDQSDPAFLAEVGARHGPFDVIVDDGSHISAHVIASFQGLFPHLADGGIYAIEDLQTSYWERPYGGSSRPDRQGTSMEFLKGMVDGLNHAEFDIPDYVPSETDRGITSIAFYHNLAFITKGRNDEPSTFLPPHPRSRRHYAARPEKQARPSASVARRLARRIVPGPIRRALLRLGGRRR